MMVTDEAIEAIVALAAECFPDECFPSKALVLLDIACGWTRVNLGSTLAETAAADDTSCDVTPAVVARVVAERASLS